MPSQADESERVFVAAAAGLLAGDDDLDVGALAVEDVVDEGDLGLDVVEIAGPPVAVEVDVGGDAPQLVLGNDLGPAILGRREAGREEAEAEKEADERHERLMGYCSFMIDVLAPAISCGRRPGTRG